MGQSEIYDLLKNYRNKWLNRYHIAKLLPKHSKGQLTSALTKLRKSGFLYKKIVFEKIPNQKNNTVYPVRYYKLVPKGKKVVLTGRRENDILE